MKSPFGLFHHRTEREEGEDQKKKTQNHEEGSKPEQICAICMPCAVYPRERKRGKEKPKHITTHNREKEKKGYICMKYV